jgi:hypothetical protein
MKKIVANRVSSAPVMISPMVVAAPRAPLVSSDRFSDRDRRALST